MRIIAAIGLFTLSFGVPAAAQTLAPAANAFKIYNFGKVNDDYYRGAQPTGSDYAALAALGIKTVVNLTNDEDGDAIERELVERHGMRYVAIPMTTRKPPTDAEIAAFLAAVDEEGAVYVHCVGGRHRTGLMTAVYRMTRDGLTGKQAFQEMKQFKYGPDFLHPEFKKFVHAYQSKADTAAASQQQ
jgi:protein tyrosine/serine phosphatase